jgi:hypothetical protein
MTIRSRSNPYEVYCPRCSVTFPVGQKNCVHCGGRLSKERLEPAEFAIPFEEMEEVQEETATKRSAWSPLALVWLILFVGGTIYRACVGE